MARGDTELQTRAAGALARAQDDPDGAAREAAMLLELATERGDAAAVSAAYRILGLVRRDAGDLAEGRRLLEEAASVAARAGARAEVGLARLSLVGLHLLAGRLAEGRAVAREAAADLDELGQACLTTQLAPLEEHAGHLERAKAAYDAAIPVFEAHGDRVWLWRARSNRAITLGYLGRLGDAEMDLDRAEALGPVRGVRAASLLLNRAWLAGLRADVPRALALYDEAAAAARRAGWPVGQVWRDRAEMLASVGLWAEAAEVAAAAVSDLDHSMPVAAPEARLVCATALAGAGDWPLAAATAKAAASQFRSQDRETWAARADVLAIAVSDGAEVGDVVAATTGALDAAAVLSASGFAAEALEARALAVRLALQAGRSVPAAALPLVPPVGPPWVRARAWLAEAHRRMSAGDRLGAVRAASAGLRTLELLRSSLGSVELRAGLAGVAADLADFLVDAAAGGRDPRRLLAVADRRVGTVVRSDVSADSALGMALAALRAAAGRAVSAGDGVEAAVALRAVADTEADVRRLARVAAGRDAAGPVLDVPALIDRLGRDWALLRFIVSAGAVIAVVVDQRGCRRFDLGAVDPVVAAGDRLRAALRRQASRPVPRAAGAVRAAAGEIDDVLLRPMRPRLGARAVIVVPDGPLHGVAFGALPSLAGRPVTTAPSARTWLAATDRPATPSGPALFAAGPGLHAAADEVRAAAAAWRAAGHATGVLTGLGATVAGVREGLEGAALAHLACHGRVRSDSPPFSSLELADGALTGFDLDLVGSPPSVVVLAACDLGGAAAASSSGGEVLGFPAWLLGAGTRTVIASLVPVPDAIGAAVFGTVASALARGLPPAEAVVAASAVDPAVGAGLVCVGAG